MLTGLRRGAHAIKPSAQLDQSRRRVLTPEEDVFFRLAWTDPGIGLMDIAERIGVWKPTVLRMAARMRLGEKVYPPKGEPQPRKYHPPTPEQKAANREKEIARRDARNALRVPAHCLHRDVCDLRGKDNRCGKCERRLQRRLGKLNGQAHNARP